MNEADMCAADMIDRLGDRLLNFGLLCVFSGGGIALTVVAALAGAWEFVFTIGAGTSTVLATARCVYWTARLERSREIKAHLNVLCEQVDRTAEVLKLWNERPS